MRRTTAWIALGVGAASLVGAGVSFAVRQSALDTVDSQCSSHSNCDPQLQSTANRGATASTLVDGVRRGRRNRRGRGNRPSGDEPRARAPGAARRDADARGRHGRVEVLMRRKLVTLAVVALFAGCGFPFHRLRGGRRRLGRRPRGRRVSRRGSERRRRHQRRQRGRRRCAVWRHRRHLLVGR